MPLSNEAPTDIILSGDRVAENAANGAVVGTVTGIDPDAGAVLSYALTDDAGGRFAIDALTGVVTVANGTLLNFEGAVSHDVTVRVTDQDGLTFDKTFSLGVGDVNEAPTGATLTGNTVAENAVNGTLVGTVTGSDPDAGAVLSYALTDDAGGRFAIDALTGVVTVANGTLLNFEGAASHDVTVRVTDQDGLTFDKTFSLGVGDVNEAPTGATLTGDTVAENAANGTVVGTVTGADPDVGAVLSYTLTDDAGGRFAIDASTGVLTVANGTLLNFESAVSHDVTVRVTDQDGMTFDKTFSLGISDVNEAPTGATLAGNTIAENAANGTVVGVVTGGDPDAGAVLSYALTDDAGGRFAIDASTGVVTVADGTLLNFESAASHDVTVRVTDQDGLTFDKTFSLSVGDVNEAPTGAALTGNTVAENAANGTVVGTVTGSDPDAGGLLNYILIDDAGGRFAVNALTGVVTVANGALLDFESATSHDVTVRVTDQDGLTFDKSFTLGITNVSGHFVGTSGDDVVIGSNEEDQIQGLGGNDTLRGSLGPDVLDGGSGNDTASYAGSAGGVVASLAQPATNTGEASGDTYISIENLLGSAFADTLTGDANGNRLVGGAGDDSLDGGSGSDTLEGGTGADSLIGGAGVDTASYAGAETGVTASLAAAAGNAGDAGGDTYSGIENLIGSAFADSLVGDAGSNTLSGGDGDDSLDGGSGDDTLLGGLGADILIGGAGNDAASYVGATAGVTASLVAPAGNIGEAAGDTYSGIENLIGSAFADSLTGDAVDNVLNGGAGNDNLDGGSGDDILIGGVGADALTGGAGTDTASYATASSGVTANMAGPAGNTGDAAGDTYSGIENLTGGAFNDMLAGSTGVNVIDGGAGDDILIGGAGADVLIGGSGSDTASYVTAALGVVSSLTTPASNTGDAAGDTYSGIENLTGSNFADDLLGDTGSNILDGGAGNDNLDGDTGNDILIGGAGADLLTGGAGNDTASYVTASAAVTANLANATGNTGDAANDTYRGIENLTGTAFGDVLIGEANANVLDGGAGNDVLTGGASGDVLIGGSGIDTASYATAAGSVVASLTVGRGTLMGDAAGDTYFGIENLTGSNNADSLYGDGNANVIDGGAGNDNLYGDGGADTLIGGAGNDAVRYGFSTAGVTVSLVSGVGHGGDAEGDTYSGIEYVYGSAYADTFIGNAAGNFFGGGAGDDTYYVSDSSIGLYEDSGQGNDTVIVQTTSFSVADGGEIENLTAALTQGTLITGSATDNVITGNIGNDSLDGGAGNDTLIGNDGDDVLYGRLGNDILNGGAGNDTLYGDDGDNTLTGGTGNDTLIAGYGNNTLDGGAGNDTLVAVSGINMLLGGAGADTLTVNGGVGTLDGGDDNDILHGGIGNDTLLGGAGNDSLEGGSGSDVLNGGDGIDTATYTNAGGSVVASLAAGGGTLGNATGDTFFAIENLTGSNYADSLYGDGNANVLDGGAGNDNLYGDGGADTLIGGAGNDAVRYGFSTAGVTVSLVSGVGHGGDAEGDTYSGIEYAYGSAYADTFIGNAAGNFFGGGAGDDTYYVSDSSIGLYEYSGQGNDTVIVQTTSFSVADGGEIENLTAALTQGTVITGSETDNVITGNIGNDSLDGGAGNDTLIGNDGDDVLYGRLGNDILNGGAGNDTLYGDDGDNTLTGGTGNDTLIAGYGNNTLDGGAGNDTLVAVSGINMLLGGAGADTLTVNGGVGTLDGGDDNDILHGGIGNDTLLGGAGNDSLEGGSGSDVLSGGDGIDTATYANAGGSVVASLAAGGGTLGNATGDTFFAIENLTGSNYADSLYGDGNANVLDGGAGNDNLYGDGGADTLIGGAGADTVRYTESAAGVTVSLTTGVGHGGDAEGDTYSGIEAVYGTAYADTLMGNSAGNYLNGGGGDDTLYGDLGDSLEGGTGNDTYYVSDSSVVLNESSGGGNDTVIVQTTSFSVADGGEIENLTAALTQGTVITGSATDNIITGNIGNDSLDGGAGNDTLIGNDGDDVLYGRLGNDILNGGAGNDTLYGDDGDNMLTGGTGNDTLIAGYGNNTLDGGAGNDTLVAVSGINMLLGGAGADTLTVNGGVGTLDGGDDNDILHGGIGNDTLLGGAGNDSLEGGSGADVLNGGDGIDTATYANAGGTVVASLTTGQGTLGNAAGDTYVGIENLTGSNYGDRLYGDGNANVLDGGSGNDNLYGDGGADTLIGGAGIDAVLYGFSTSGVTVSLASGVGSGGDAEGDTYSGIEYVYGSDYADTLTGNAADNNFWSGAGNDTLLGGGGNDTFVFSANFGKDTVADFAAGAGAGDVIQVDTSLFANFAAIQSHAQQVGADTVITLDAANTITLQNVTVGHLAADDFWFV